MSEQNKAVVRRLIEDHWNGKNGALVRDLFAPTVSGDALAAVQRDRWADTRHLVTTREGKSMAVIETGRPLSDARERLHGKPREAE